MRMQLHADSIIGDIYTYPIYDIDYSVFAALPNFTTTISPTVSEGYTINKWYVENNTGVLTNGLPASIPRKPEQSGNILPQRFVYTEELGGINYLENWFDPSYYEVLTTQPFDWGTNPNYLKIPDTTGSYRYVIGKIAGRSETFTANSCYKDLKRMCCRKFYTNRGGHFAVTKCGSYDRLVRNTCQWTVGRPPMNWNDATAEIQKNYMFVSDTTGNYFNTSFYISRITDNAGAGAAFNSNLIFVHYTLSNVEYYGVAEILFNTFEDDAIPIRIMVCGIDKSFWNENIIPGGESGEGSWGSNNQPTISEGTFSGRSDSVTRDPTDPHSNAKQYSDISDDRVGIFGQYGGYHIYAIPHWSSTNTDFKTIMEILYGTDFWSRWVNSNFNPLSAIISLGMIPYDFANSTHIGYYQPLVVAGFNISNQFPGDPPNFPCLNSVSRVAFDAIDINKYFGGYADFAPYTQAILHLPFVGDVTLDVNSMAHGKLGVEYLCDVANGNIVAWIWTEDYTGENSQYIACAKGNCMYSLPLFSMSQDGSGLGRIFLGITSAVVGAALASPTMALGGVAAAYSGAEKMVGISGTRSGNLDGNISSISPKEVWLEIIRPKWCENMFYQKLRGIPSEMSHYISDCGQETDSAGNPIPTGVAYDGYIKISEIELDGVNATDAEKEEIEALLKAGVYIRGAEL